MLMFQGGSYGFQLSAFLTEFKCRKYVSQFTYQVKQSLKYMLNNNSCD